MSSSAIEHRAGDVERRRIGAGPLGLIVFAFLASMAVVSVLIVTTSIAVFSDTTDTAGSSFSVGSVTLVDDDAAGSIFSVTNMTPARP